MNLATNLQINPLPQNNSFFYYYYYFYQIFFFWFYKLQFQSYFLWQVEPKNTELI